MNSKEIANILLLMKKSEMEWRADYGAVWQYANYLKNYIDAGKGRDELIVQLPAFKENQMKYNIESFHKIITSRDDYFAYSHLQYMFSLLEELIKEASNILDKKKINKIDFKLIIKFLYEKGFAKIPELNELWLAKETRNCYIHSNGKVDKSSWFNAYKTARKKNAEIEIGNNVKKAFEAGFIQTVKEWHDIIVTIAEKIEEKIKSTFLDIPSLSNLTHTEKTILHAP